MTDRDLRDDELGPLYCDYCLRYGGTIHPWEKCEGGDCECECQEEPDRPMISRR